MWQEGCLYQGEQIYMKQFNIQLLKIHMVRMFLFFPLQVRVIGRPDPPVGPLEFDDIQARSVRVSWRPPSDDGGSDILGYIVERREVSKAAWYTVDSRVIENSLVVKGLKENVGYHFKISAENQFGVSRSLKSDESVTPKTPLCKN